MPHNSTEESEDLPGAGLSRRRLLATVGAGSIAGFAGCNTGGGGNGTDTTGGGGGDGGPVDDTFNAFYTLNPPDDLYFNPFGTVAAGMGLYHWAMLYTGVALWDRFNPERALSGILGGHPRYEDPIEDGTARFSIREDLTWHNGDPYTAKDYETGRLMQLYIAQSTDGEEAIPYTDVRAVDDYTVEVDMRDPSVPHDPWWSTMYGTNLHHSCCTISNGPMWVKHSEWVDYRERYEDATSDDEMNTITSELQNVTRPFEETIGYGPWQISEISGQTVVYEPWEEWPGLMTFNWPDRDSGSTIGGEVQQYWIDNDMTAELTFYADRNAVGSAALGGELDFARISSVSQGDQLVNQEGWAKPPRTGRVYSGGTLVGFHVNFDHPSLAKPQVRKALLHLMNQQQLAQIGYQNTDETSQQSPVPIPAPVGMGWGSARQWLDVDAVKSNWSRYTPEESDAETAASLLEDAGLTRSGGNWQREDGERLRFDIKQSSDRPVQVSRAFRDRLNNFGIATQFTAIESTQVSGTLRSGDFDLFYDFDEGAMGWPGREFQQGFEFVGQGYPWNSDQAKQVNHPETWEVPSTVGDPESELESFDPIPLVNQLNESGNDHESIVRELAWASNQTVQSLVYANGAYTPDPGDRRAVGLLYNDEGWKALSREENYGLNIMGATGNPGYPQSRHHFGAFEPVRE